jgi:hypothetical protein
VHREAATARLIGYAHPQQQHNWHQNHRPREPHEPEPSHYRRREQQHRQREQVMNQVGEHGHRRKDLRRAHDLSEQRSVVRQHHGGVEQRSRPEQPRQQSRKEEERIRNCGRHSCRDDEREDYGVDRQQEEGVEQRPQVTEERSAVPCLEVARNQCQHQPALAVERGEHACPWCWRNAQNATPGTGRSLSRCTYDS